MRARLAASAILIALLTAGTTGCTFMTPQATIMNYDPSDGIRATVGDIKINNALLVSEDGENASLVVSLHNTSDQSIRVKLQYENSKNAKVNDTISVPAGSVVSLGGKDATKLVLSGITAPTGDLFPVFFQYGDVTGQQMWLPVLAPNDPYVGLAP